MAIQINQLGPCFAGEVSGIDLTEPLSPEDAAAIHAGMDEYAVLVFHGQELTNEQQLAFTQALGPLEQAIGTSLRQAEDQRLPTTFADVSNLDKDNKPFAVDDRRRLFAIGNRLWHSDSSFKVIPAKYSLLHAHSIPSTGGNTEFADMRAAYDYSTRKRRIWSRTSCASIRKSTRAPRWASPTSRLKSESASSPCASVSCESTQ